MAGGAIVNSGGGKEYPGNLTVFVFLTCFVAATGGLIFGYDIGISGEDDLIFIIDLDLGGIFIYLLFELD